MTFATDSRRTILPASRRRFLEVSMATAAALGVACAARRSPQRTVGSAQPGATLPPATADGEAAGPNVDQGGEPAARETSTLLILGGTGFLGPHVVESARARNIRVTLFNRGKTNPHLFPDLEKLRGDRNGDLSALQGRSWDAVLDTSGYVPRTVRASASLLAPAVAHYVFISSISVYPDFPFKGITEDYKLATLEDEANEDVGANYGALKALCERSAEDSMPGRVTSIRPGLIVGPGDPTDRFTYWPVRLARGGEVAAPGSGEDPVQHIDVRDLAAWIIHMIAERITGVYNATGPARPMTARSMLERCKTAVGSAAALTWVDAKFLEQHNVTPWMDMPAWVPADGDSLGFGSIDCSKAISRGLQFRELEDTARDTLAWFDTLPTERRAKMRAGLTAERETALLAAWHARAGTTVGSF